MTERQLSDNDLYEYRHHYKKDKSNRRFYFIICLLIICLLSFRVYWTQNFGGVYVDGYSMWPTLETGDELLINYNKEAKRGDIIVVDLRKYNFPGDTDFLIKRLIATEGDELYCKNSQVYIKYAGTDKFVALDEPYLDPNLDYDFSYYKVGKDEIFFLGDNRTNSIDSRYKEGRSHFSNRLYTKDDIYGVVCGWSVKHKDLIRWLPIIKK